MQHITPRAIEQLSSHTALSTVDMKNQGCPNSREVPNFDAHTEIAPAMPDSEAEGYLYEMLARAVVGSLAVVQHLEPIRFARSSNI